MTATEDTLFLLRRAEEEAILAIRSQRAEASAAHQTLSLRYSERALAALAEEDEARPQDFTEALVIALPG